MKGRVAVTPRFPVKGLGKCSVVKAETAKQDAGLVGQLSIRCLEFKTSAGLPGGDNTAGSWKCIFLKLS